MARQIPLSQKIRFAAAVFFLCAAVCGAAAVIVIDWFRVNRNGILAKYGLWYQTKSDSLDAADNFPQIGFNSIITTLCFRDGSSMEHRNYVSQGTAVTGLILAFIACTLSPINNGAVLKVQIGVALIATFLQIFTASWAAYIYENWYYCDRTPCVFLRDLAVAGGNTPAPCSYRRGSAWNLQVGAACCCFVGLLLAILAKLLRKKVGKEITMPAKAAAPPAAPSAPVHVDGERPHNSGKPRGPTTKPANVLEANSAAHVTREGKNELPPGDWVFDRASGLYWSENEKLFLHLETAMFYDPATDMWCNSETGEWFHPEK
jgi:hypothetical protein